jgi:6-pyruvoyltetrahydropterin/6-carboxytetrahydropterin synthase
MKHLTVAKEFHFEAAHSLPHLPEGHKCRNVHGHRYRVEITVSAPDLDHAGRVVDFGVVKELVGGWIDEKLDHGYLAAPWDDVVVQLAKDGHKVFIMPEHLGEPTAENIAALVFEQAQTILSGSGHLIVSKVRVYETPNCWADYEG